MLSQVKFPFSPSCSGENQIMYMIFQSYYSSLRPNKKFSIIMIQNLKEFVTKFVQRESHAHFPQLYIVDKQTGPFRKIQDAINAADPYSLIKVTEGFYEQNLVINKPLTIQPKSVGQKSNQIGVVLLVQSGVGIRIRLPFSENQVKISGLKISHTGCSSELQMELIQHQHILNIFENEEKQCDQLQNQYINRVIFSKIENIIVFVEVGKVSLSMCVLSLKYLVKSCRIMIPAICIEKQGQLFLENCQVKGNQEKDTAGIFCKLGVLRVKNCSISDHKEGGIVIWGGKDNPSEITKSRLQRNSVGIYAVGDQFKMKICQNQIMSNKVGVKVGLACQVEISRNLITENGNGIEVYSSFPLIYLNKIEKNSENGIVSSTYKRMICQAKIKKNSSITGNKQNGILVLGQKNKTKITDNYLIGFNSQSGIKVCKQSYPLILKNKIHKNFNEGILITEDANAIVQKNSISSNVETNIALGGAISNNTLVVENAIFGSPGPGIIMIQGLANIFRNDINQNLEGVKLIQSGGRVRRNFIYQNSNNGIICEGQCNPTIVQNFITRNSSIGLFIREQAHMQSELMIYSNIIISNQINIGLQFESFQISKNLKASNTIQGQIEQPKGFGCNLM